MTDKHSLLTMLGHVTSEVLPTHERHHVSSDRCVMLFQNSSATLCHSEMALKLSPVNFKGNREKRCPRRFKIMQNQSLSSGQLSLPVMFPDLLSPHTLLHAPPLSPQRTSPPPSQGRQYVPLHWILSPSRKVSRSHIPSLLLSQPLFNWFLPIDLLALCCCWNKDQNGVRSP